MLLQVLFGKHQSRIGFTCEEPPQKNLSASRILKSRGTAISQGAMYSFPLIHSRDELHPSCSPSGEVADATSLIDSISGQVPYIEGVCEDYRTFKMVRVLGRQPGQLVSVTSAYDAAVFLLQSPCAAGYT